MALIANVHVISSHGFCITDYCDCDSSICFDAVSSLFDFLYNLNVFPRSNLFFFVFFFRINVSKECGPFNKHQLIFYVIRGDILKLQEVFAEIPQIMYTFIEYLFIYLFVSLFLFLFLLNIWPCAVFTETCTVAIDNAACPASCNRWHALNPLVWLFPFTFPLVISANPEYFIFHLLFLQ